MAAGTPDLRSFTSEAEFRTALDQYVKQIESIFEQERGQWGQLVSEIRPTE